MDAAGQRNCEEDDGDMNFAFTTAGGGGSGTHFVTTGGGQMQVAKLQQGVANNAALSQMVGMVGGDGVQYVRTLDGGAALTHTPQLITLPIALPGAKPGDPQPTVQIQVLNPNLLQQQQPKYQMQIPIQGLQGFQQGGAVLTVAYTPEANDGSLQLLGNGLPDGLQVLTLPPEMQLMQPAQAHLHGKEQHHHPHQQPTHQVFITQNQQIIVNNSEQNKLNNNTTNNNNNEQDVIIKEECDDMNDDESSQGTEGSGAGGVVTWQSSSSQDLVNYLNKLPQQQTQQLPVSLQQFLRLNPSDKQIDTKIEIEINPQPDVDKKDESIAEAILGEDGTVRIKKKKKYKKKPPKPAKPKPGQVVITTATDGTSIYCCPECQMAYSDKDQLEMHLSVHKIERRFICGICGAGLKRKEHLERHKLGHNPERPYVCAVCRKGFKRREHLNLHTVIHSGVKTELCLECGKGFYRKDHLRKHTRSHETKRARDESLMSCEGGGGGAGGTATVTENKLGVTGETAEITIVVPTSANVQVPVQINIPQHVVSSLQAQHQAQLASNNQMGNNQQLSNNQNSLDALLAQHT